MLGRFKKLLLNNFRVKNANRRALVVNNLPANAGDERDVEFNPWVWKIPWRRK